jgi:hypothetical protein
MAMNKAEKEQFELLELQNRRLRAMNWPSYAAPQKIEVFCSETFCFILGVERVMPVVSNGDRMRHQRCDGKLDPIGVRANGGCFYSTELDALKALRIQMTQGFAEKLAAVDEQIERMEIEERSQFMREYRTGINTGGRDE